ncbi:diguanylate cyclase [Gilvimarinus xylanilyticus]|uniref:diguanylate cyclase n=1 Tax=Gilvimarinus xylanilyticus TaxID=2944139 RepID=A0A9X2I2Q0_9GAMM|nr:diguanylate cyclase [Gilvimarinus xylanilyticus]MCP8897842.1 diguanylate cyclase [Gilvimarinus xylanilyticus]
MSSDKKAIVAQKLKALRDEYRQKLPQALAHISNLANEYLSDETVLPSLKQQVHKLAGSAGTFGYSELSQSARELELLLQGWEQQPPGEQERSKALKHARALDQFLQGAAEPQSPTSYPSFKGDEPEVDRLIYLVEDDTSLAEELSATLNSFGYRVRHFTSPSTAEPAIVERRPDFLIVDVMFAGEQRQGPDSIQQIQENMADPLPVVFISGRDDFDAYLGAVRAGAVGYFVKPLDIPQLIDCLEAHLKLHQAEPYRVLIVDDDVLLSHHYRLLLESAGMRVETIQDPRKVLQVMREFHPEVVLLDLNLPDCRGYELAQLIRLHSEWLRVVIAYLSAEQDEYRQIQAIRNGGEDFLTKPISDMRLVSAVAVRAARSRQLSDAIDRDSLTGLLKHARIKEEIALELERAARQGKPVSLAMIDLDYFKKVNDTYGHGAGDKVIRALAQLLRQRLRKTDSVGRYGGEEFIALLPDCDAESAYTLLDSIRENFAALGFTGDSGVFNVTLSAGLVTVNGQKTDGEKAVNIADKALYAAKSAGRNQVAATEVTAQTDLSD